MKYNLITRQHQLKDIRKANIYGCDCETTGLDPWAEGATLVMLQIHDGKQIHIIDCRKVEVEEIRWIFEDKDRVKIWHNSSFDAVWMKVHFDIDNYNIYDTRLAEQLLLGTSMPRGTGSETKRLKYSASLEYCLKRRGLPSKFVFEPFDAEAPFTESQLEYSARDVEFLHELRLSQLDKIGSQLNILKLENKVAEITYQMRAHGFHFDTEGWKEVAKQTQAAYDSAMKDLERMAPGLNPASPKQIKELIHEIGYEDYNGLTEEKKLYSEGFNPAWKDQPVIAALLKVRENSKAVTAYGLDYLKHVNSGKIHCGYNQILNTGRFSCYDPNLQQLPATGGYRECFRPGKGNVFVIADFSGQELAIMAALSKEPVWLEELRTGGDIHQATADLVGSSRQHAKAVNFAIAYGAGPDTIAVNAGITRGQAVDLVNTWKKNLRRLSTWLTRNGNLAILKGESESALGRLRQFHDEENWRKRNIGKNNPIQATGADMMKMAMAKIYRAGLTIIHTLHDEIIVECRKEEADQVLATVEKEMEAAATFVLGEALTKGEAQIADRWVK